jgi:DMSO/TMAO reductase YedYZ molybdopterin-dependent catalytic subunit
MPVSTLWIGSEFDPEQWDFRAYGLVDNAVRLNWVEFGQLPQSEHVTDFHCVTRWSRFENNWRGVAVRDLLALVKPSATASHVLIHAEQGYTTNVSIADLDREDVILATHHDGLPLAPDHGYPLQLIVPHLYSWKSAKWLRGMEFLDRDQAGFWEKNGYHMHGDPWKEQRFSDG